MVGKPAPEFSADSVSDLDFTTVSLSDYNGRYIILLFYPNDLYDFPLVFVQKTLKKKTLVQQT